MFRVTHLCVKSPAKRGDRTAEAVTPNEGEKMKTKNTKHPNIFGHSKSVPHSKNLPAMFKRWRQRLGYFSIFAALPAFLASHTQDAQAEEMKKTEMLPAGQNVRLLERLNKSRSNYRLPNKKGEFDIVSQLTGNDDCPGAVVPGGNYTAAQPYTDSGDTTGANNTVSRAYYIDYVYYNYDTFGNDQIYSFTLTGRGANPRIEVSTTSGTYRPLIYVLHGAAAGGCPSGTGNHAYNELVIFDSRWGSGNTATLNGAAVNFLPLNVPLHLFVDSRFNDANGFGSYTLRMQDVTIAPATPQAPTTTRFDFDGDDKADISVFRPSDKVWYLNRSTQGFSATQFGLSTDKIIPADFNGDRKTDINVFRDGVWYLLYESSTNLVYTIPFGLAGDIPQPADFSGDGRDELAVYRNGVWWSLNLSNNQVNAIQFGLSTDKPVAADYDGDGRADQAVYRDGEWHLNRSTQGYTVIHWGLPTDKPVPADYDGDGRADLAVYRDGTWYLLQSSAGATQFQWGIASDIPAPADYDGDGKTDAAVFRDGVWYLRQSSGGVSVQNFGLPNDKPIPAAYLP